MRMFAVLAASLVGGGVGIAMYWSSSFSVGAWYAAAVLILFAAVGRIAIRREARELVA
jgi:protein-S-isoprenylcysteine O-methyltransferase Ste14